MSRRLSVSRPRVLTKQQITSRRYPIITASSSTWTRTGRSPSRSWNSLMIRRRCPSLEGALEQPAKGTGRVRTPTPRQGARYERSCFAQAKGQQMITDTLDMGGIRTRAALKQPLATSISPVHRRRARLWSSHSRRRIAERWLQTHGKHTIRRERDAALLRRAAGNCNTPPATDCLNSQPPREERRRPRAAIIFATTAPAACISPRCPG